VSDVRYDPEKFRELVVYVASKFEDDPPLGDVKLNKILYFSDFLTYNRLGSPITGARYQKQKLGPIAVPLLMAREQLIAQNAVAARAKKKGIARGGWSCQPTSRRTARVAQHKKNRNLSGGRKLSGRLARLAKTAAQESA
jgi:hypothetical protein